MERIGIWPNCSGLRLMFLISMGIHHSAAQNKDFKVVLFKR